ncbi:hypothetical protein ACQP1O_22370 [Nocardia sp. CA-151230]|uniref:hypothetical protein n=1 Tax=Nocardia sp. CA-151230 TaxID=3239982 RepID=UPI003D8EFC12
MNGAVTAAGSALTAVTSAAVTERQVVLTATKFDRFACNVAEAGEILTSLRERDVPFGLSSQLYDWADPFGKLYPHPNTQGITAANPASAACSTSGCPRAGPAPVEYDRS